MIHRWRDKAIGITLWKWNRFMVELWYIKAGVTIPPHSHPNIHITFINLLGMLKVFKRSPVVDHHADYKACLFWPFTKLNIQPGWLHWFTVGKLPFIFINIERWLTKPTSAAIDFKEI